MDALSRVTTWIGGLIDLGLTLLALAIVAAVLVGANLPFFDKVVGNLIGLVNELGASGLSGLIVLGFIIWLFARRKPA